MLRGSVTVYAGDEALGSFAQDSGTGEAAESLKIGAVGSEGRLVSLLEPLDQID